MTEFGADHIQRELPGVVEGLRPRMPELVRAGHLDPGTGGCPFEDGTESAYPVRLAEAVQEDVPLPLAGHGVQHRPCIRVQVGYSRLSGCFVGLTAVKDTLILMDLVPTKKPSFAGAHPRGRREVQDSPSTNGEVLEDPLQVFRRDVTGHQRDLGQAGHGGRWTRHVSVLAGLLQNGAGRTSSAVGSSRGCSVSRVSLACR